MRNSRSDGPLSLLGFNALEEQAYAALLQAPILELDSDCGHLGPSCEDAKVSAAVAAFLQK